MDVLTLEEYANLLSEVQVLQLIYHRNKNQHRMATWWRYFQMLLRHLKHFFIDDDYKIIETIIKKKLMNKCFFEFYGIIKLGQFMSLGFVLVASLSRVHKLLEKFEKRAPVKDKLTEEQGKVLGHEIDIGQEDLGQEVVWNDESEFKQLQGALSDSSNTPKVTKPPKQLKLSKDTKIEKKKKKKKKSKKKSDIDLIFG